MRYRIAYAPTFLHDVEQHIAYLVEQRVSTRVIEQWYGTLYERVHSLSEWPKRFAVDETESRNTGRLTQKLNVGNYLIFYQVHDESQEVHIVAFRHGARRRDV